MFLRTSGNKAETSLPRVIAAIVFWIASLRSYAYCDTSPFRSSKVSPAPLADELGTGDRECAFSGDLECCAGYSCCLCRHGCVSRGCSPCRSKGQHGSCRVPTFSALARSSHEATWRILTKVPNATTPRDPHLL
jgi:hypothetical protein